MRLLVLYGSETGTAKDVAEQIWKQSKVFGFTGPILAMDDYDISNLINERLIVFICSTTGNGEEPKNMKFFWKYLLRKKLPSTSLQSLNFACLGLGDSSYEKYNFAVKRLRKRLISLSAEEILPIGLCDDQHDYGYRSTQTTWSTNLWGLLSKLYVLKRQIFLPKYDVVECSDGDQSPVDHFGISFTWPFREEKMKIVVKENSRATSADHFQETRYINFLHNLNWSPGDCIEIYPINSKSNIDFFFEMLEKHNALYNRNTIIECTQNYKGMV